MPHYVERTCEFKTLAMCVILKTLLKVKILFARTLLMLTLSHFSHVRFFSTLRLHTDLVLIFLFFFKKKH